MEAKFLGRLWGDGAGVRAVKEWRPDMKSVELFDERRELSVLVEGKPSIVVVSAGEMGADPFEL